MRLSGMEVFMRIEQAYCISEEQELKKLEKRREEFGELLEKKRLKKEEKSETKSRIIVKPDGSRILLLTQLLAGTELVTSLKIADGQPFADESVYDSGAGEEILPGPDEVL